MEEKVLKEPLWPMICRAQDDDNKTCHNTTSFQSCLNVFSDIGAFNRSEIYQISQFEINSAFKKAIKNPRVWAMNKAYFDSNVTLLEPRVTYMRSFFTTGGPLEIEGLYKEEFDRISRTMKKKYYQDVNLTMDEDEAKRNNWTLSNSTYIKYKNTNDRSR